MARNLVNQYIWLESCLFGEKMKRIYIAAALAAIIGLAVVVEAGMNGMENSDIGSKWQKFKHMWQNRFARHHRMQHAWRNMLNFTRMEGILESENGSYYINGVQLYLGGDAFMNSISRSDYDRDGSYEYIWQEMDGLVGSYIVVNGIIKGDTLYVSHINGIWLRMPRESPEITELEGVLEYINGSYYINGIELLIKHGFSKSDIDGDMQLERMDEEMNGLVGQQITVDGFMNEKGFVVLHVNGIWAR